MTYLSYHSWIALRINPKKYKFQIILMYSYIIRSIHLCQHYNIINIHRSQTKNMIQFFEFKALPQNLWQGSFVLHSRRAVRTARCSNNSDLLIQMSEFTPVLRAFSNSMSSLPLGCVKQREQGCFSSLRSLSSSFYGCSCVIGYF